MPTLSEAREAKNLSRSELARAVGVDASYLSKIERGLRRLTAERRRALERVLGTSFDQPAGPAAPPAPAKAPAEKAARKTATARTSAKKAAKPAAKKAVAEKAAKKAAGRAPASAPRRAGRTRPAPDITAVDGMRTAAGKPLVLVEVLPDGTSRVSAPGEVEVVTVNWADLRPSAEELDHVVQLLAELPGPIRERSLAQLSQALGG